MIEDTASGTAFDSRTGTKLIVANGCDRCVIKNLTLQNAYVHTASTDSSIDQTQMNAITIDGSGWSVHDNTIHDAGWGITTLEPCSTGNTRIYNNDIYNVDHGWTVSSASHCAHVGPFFFYGNHVHDLANWDTDDNAYHHDGIHCFDAPGTTGAHMDGLYIYNNRFDGDIGGHATSWVFIEGGTGPSATPCSDVGSEIDIFNNIFTTSNGRYVTNGFVAVSTGTVGFYNNTVIGANKSAGSVCTGFTTVGHITLNNNIIQGCNQLIGGLTPSFDRPTALDYNLYGDCDGSYNCWWLSGPGGADTGSFTKWRSATIWDGHSQEAVSQTHVGLDTNGRPTKGSHAIAAGISLRSLCTGNLTPLCTDLLGARRPLRMPPDVGAIQYENAAITATGIGEIRLGEPLTTAEQFYGRASRGASGGSVLDIVEVGPGGTVVYRRHGGTLALAYRDGLIVAVATTSSYYSTAGGMHVGGEIDGSQLARGGWTRCGDTLLENRSGTTTALRVSGARIVMAAIARTPDMRCRKGS